MLINDTLYTICTIIAPILFFVGLSVFVKRKFNSYYGVFFGLIFSGLIFGALQASAGTVYIINSKTDIKSHRVFGTFEFEFVSKIKESINVPQGNTVVINNLKDPIVIDVITYGQDGYYKNKPEWEEIVNDIDSNYYSNNDNAFFMDPQSHEAFVIPYNTINFFFDDEIPQVIKEFGVRGNIKKYWLHDLR